MRVLEFAPEIVLDGGAKGAGLLAVVDHLDIHDLSAARVEGEPCPAELREEHGQVEAPEVESGEVTRLEDLEQAPRPRGEWGLTGHILVGDPVHK